MPTVTGQTLLDEVRDIADEPSDGDGAKAYATDTFILRRLTDRYRKLVKAMLRVGYPYSRTTQTTAAPGASVSLTTALAVLAVYVKTANARYKIPRLVDELGPVNNGNSARYWYPTVSASSADVTLNLTPSETANSIEVVYVPEPGALAVGTTIHLPSSWKDVLVYGTALDCYAKRNAQNQFLRDAYNEALVDAEVDAANFAADAAVRNTDDLYTPGYVEFNDERYDYALYVLP